jgi:hypothetical protein
LIMKGCLTLSKAFCVSVKVIMWFLVLILYICYPAFNYVSVLNHLRIPEMKPLDCGECFF